MIDSSFTYKLVFVRYILTLQPQERDIARAMGHACKGARSELMRVFLKRCVSILTEVPIDK